MTKEGRTGGGKGPRNPRKRGPNQVNETSNQHQNNEIGENLDEYYSKSFGFALLLAVGIIAVMVAMGTFSAQKAGAQVEDAGTVVDADATGEGNPVSIKPATPAPGAAVQVELTDDFDGTVEGYGTLEIELKGFGVPSSIDPRDVFLHSTGATPPSGNPFDVDVSNGVISLELNADADDGTTAITATEDVVIVFRKRAGITAPTEAGKYDVFIDGYEANEIVTVNPSFTLDPKKGGGATEITVSGKAFANGTGTLYTEYLATPDTNNDGIVDELVEGPAPATLPTLTDNEGWGIDTDGNGELDLEIRATGTEADATYVAYTPDDPDATPAVEAAQVDELGYMISGYPNEDTTTGQERWCGRPVPSGRRLHTHRIPEGRYGV